MASNLPSSFSKSGTQPGPAAYPSSSASSPRQAPQTGSADVTPALFLGFVALIISFASFYGAFFMDRPASPSQKAALMGIAEELRSLQTRDITLSAPVQTTVSLNKSYLIRDMFPESFEVPLEFNIPIDTQLVAVSTTGQPVAFRVQESVPIKVIVPVSTASTFGDQTVQIKKEIPVEARFASSVKIRAAYGTELNGIIDRLEKLAGETSASD